MVLKSGQIFLPFCQGSRVTDGRTDRQTEFSSLYRVCISCSAVKRKKESAWVKLKAFPTNVERTNNALVLGKLREYCSVDP